MYRNLKESVHTARRKQVCCALPSLAPASASRAPARSLTPSLPSPRRHTQGQGGTTPAPYGTGTGSSEVDPHSNASCTSVPSINGTQTGGVVAFMPFLASHVIALRHHDAWDHFVDEGITTSTSACSSSCFSHACDPDVSIAKLPVPQSNRWQWHEQQQRKQQHW